MRLGNVLKVWRERQGLGLRAVAQDMGISHVTLDRLEEGDDVGGQTIIKVLFWLLGKQ